MFLDQLTTQDGWMLNNWKYICSKNFNQGITSSRIPQWFNKVQHEVININDGLRLIKPSYYSAPFSHLKGSVVLQSHEVKQKFPFITIWHNAILYKTIFLL